ncbi:MAG: hypothetical protein ABIF82_15075 [Planctomycetota bacterium]
MIVRILAVCGLIACFVLPCSADTIVFQDGTKKTVRIYKTTREYVSFLHEGKIYVVPRSKIKKKGMTFDSKPLTENELAEALKKSRDELKKKLHEEEKTGGVKPGKDGEVKSVTGDNKPKKGVKIIAKEESETKEVELKIDPFPDHPVTDEEPKKK